MADRADADAGFHPGELAVQRQAGVGAQAQRLAGMVEPAELVGGVVRFLADRTFAALTGRDDAGRLWVSPLTGPPGFLRVASASTLSVRAAPSGGDALHGLPVGQSVGLIVIEFATRRRMRINGVLVRADNDHLIVEVQQAFGNCPKYIQGRDLEPAPELAAESASRTGADLDVREVDQIRRADTFFLGTTNPERGSDASHRGGPPSFVRVEGRQLWWPDYPGNNMFNSFGNLSVDDEAALLFPDFTTGRTLQLTGSAEVEWGAPGRTGDDGHTGRIVRFTLERLVSGRLLSVRESQHEGYPRNPAVGPSLS